MRALLALLLVLAVSACETTMSSPASNSGIARSANAQPGTISVSEATAVNMFTELCVRQAPKFAGTEAMAAVNGFVQNTTFGTYYHSKYNLSVKLIGGDCSMVFASTASAARLQLAFANLETHGPKARFRLALSQGGAQLYNVRIASN